MVLSDVLKPLARRVGTALAAVIVAQGVPNDTADQIATGAVAAMLLILDLVHSKFDRRP